jgi:23S rRNA pseudouridine1911/1915/1917 synthase
VHLAHIGHPVLGDPAYGSGFKTRIGALADAAQPVAAALERQALHASELQFEHPTTGKKLSFNSPLPPDLAALAKALRQASSRPTEGKRKQRSR